MNNYVLFSDIAHFRNGLNFSKDSHGKGCLLIGVSDFKDNFTPQYENVDEINPDGIASDDDYLKKGDLIYVRSNGNKALVGRSMFIERDVRALYSGFCIRARLHDNIIDPAFLAYFSKSSYFKRSISHADGTNINNLNQVLLGEVKIPLFTRIEQKKIAESLSFIDKKIKLNNKINTELEAMAKLIYDYWFVQFDFPDENGKPYKSSGGRMVYNAELKREIPEKWDVRCLSESLNIYDSLRVPVSKKERESRVGDYPYYGATGIMGFIDDYIFEGEHILLAEDGSIMGDDGMPIVQYIWGKTWVNNHAHVLKAKNELHNEFYFQTLKRIPVVLIKTGSIQLKINQVNLMEFKAVTPPLKLIDKYSDIVRNFRLKMINNTNQVNELKKLRDWLLPMLMNGQVTVSDKATD